MSIFARQEGMFSQEEMNKISGLSVLIAGTGGLGTHQALELQRVGVKKVYLVDDDQVELSNLNRQILYGKKDVGEIKVEKAAEFLNSFELETEIIPVKRRITEEFMLPEDIDLVFDALDNYEARLLMAEKARKNSLPFIHGAVEAWSGQVAAVDPGQEPGFSDIFSKDYAGDREIPVFSPVVSLVANYQVIEGIKVAIGKSPNLIGKLMLIDSKNNETEIFSLK